jgi:hypothetical protein
MYVVCNHVRGPSVLGDPDPRRTDRFRVNRQHPRLTFEEWDPSVDTDASQDPVEMIVNSSEFLSTDFDLREVIPLQLEETARGDRRTRGAALKQIHNMGTRRYVLSVDNDNEFRSLCE